MFLFNARSLATLLVAGAATLASPAMADTVDFSGGAAARSEYRLGDGVVPNSDPVLQLNADVTYKGCTGEIWQNIGITTNRGNEGDYTFWCNFRLDSTGNTTISPKVSHFTFAGPNMTETSVRLAHQVSNATTVDVSLANYAWAFENGRRVEVGVNTRIGTIDVRAYGIAEEGLEASPIGIVGVKVGVPIEDTPFRIAVEGQLPVVKDNTDTRRAGFVLSLEASF